MIIAFKTTTCSKKITHLLRKMMMDVELNFGSVLASISMFLYYFFGHRFYMDLSSVLQVFSCICCKILLIFMVLHPIGETKNKIIFTILLRDLPFLKHMLFDNCRDMFRCSFFAPEFHYILYQCWHHFGILFA